MRGRWSLRVAGRAALLGAALHGMVPMASPAVADDRTVFHGCVVGQSTDALTLATSGDERVEIMTTWLRPEDLASSLVDCVTIRAVLVEGRYVAESIQAGDEPNEVRGITAETTRDREKRDRDNADDRGDKKQR